MLPQELSSVAFGSITNSYTTLATLENPTRLVKIVNYTDAPVLISWNGDATTDDDFIPEKGFTLYDITTNQSFGDKGEFIAEGVVFSLKYSDSAPTLGSVYLVALYAEEA